MVKCAVSELFCLQNIFKCIVPFVDQGEGRCSATSLFLDVRISPSHAANQIDAEAQRRDRGENSRASAARHKTRDRTAAKRVEVTASVHLYGILASEGRETHRIINETQPRKNDNASLRERNGRVVAFYKTFTKLTNSITRPNALESLALARSPTEQGWDPREKWRTSRF